MQFIFLPYLIYTATMQALFRDWGTRPERAVILASHYESQDLHETPTMETRGGI